VDNLDAMRRAVWCIYFHTFSSDENPTHHLCPSNSWCKYNVARTEGLPYHHTKVISQAIANVVKPIFQDLSAEDLLSRCLHGNTQNQNESFNNVVWGYLPKETFVGHTVMQIGAFEAVIAFNDGFQSCKKVLKKMGIPYNFDTATSSAMIDERRIRKADVLYKMMLGRHNKKRRAHQDNINTGDSDYLAGGF
jgi:hypothetical protein